MTEEFEYDEYIIGVPEYEVHDESPKQRSHKEKERRRNARRRQARKKKTMNIELTKTSEGTYEIDVCRFMVVQNVIAEGAQDTKIEKISVRDKDGTPIEIQTPFSVYEGDIVRVELSGTVPAYVRMIAKPVTEQSESPPQEAPPPSDPFGNFDLPEFLLGLLPLFHEAMLIKSQKEAEARYQRLVEESKKMYITRIYPEGAAISSPEDELGSVYVMHDYALKDDGSVVVMWEATPPMENELVEETGTEPDTSDPAYAASL